jgi:ADP-ribose pyrophosphatase
MGEKSAEQERFEKASAIDRREVYRGRTIALRCDTLKKADGSLKKWDIVVHPGAVVLIPITDKGEIILVKQWRRAIEKRIIELPAGTLESGEPPEVCAQRELQEETGFRANQIIPLGGFYTTPGFCTEYLHLFIALDLEADPLPADDDEGIDLLFTPLEKAEKMIEKGEICDAKTIAGILRYAKWSTQS